VDRIERDLVARIARRFHLEDMSKTELAVACSVSVQELLDTPRVLAVAGSLEKIGAIAAVARSGLITVLVTDDRAAVALLALPPVAARAHGRPRRGAVSACR
jgi:DNA-binding transcriptional regulator LsrR (DeoR family)